MQICSKKSIIDVKYLKNEYQIREIEIVIQILNNITEERKLKKKQ